ncbi:MAG: SusC/RagA family TonB-linked outer membrane protein [Candidatus Pseudobacter hemicellulosilyticus]|uniref:SusC/RagA family TonB-linked outer membrane protein n=1 Tax=Candidatus Pseudobacter hemicellulosilyticus TaxID=3121375 RepID=A0AAJ6BK25_9BACT|nr:MAG: SusC/RagA family TonB-linked outer membrane protein [Pseudobacter sp.]
MEPNNWYGSAGPALPVPAMRLLYCRKCRLFKKLLTVKVLAFFLTLACLQVSAGSRAQVSLSVKDSPLERVLEEIRRQGGVHIFYKRKDIENAGKVTLELKQVAVETALDKVLEGRSLAYSMEGKNVFIMRRAKAEGVSMDDPADDSLVSVRGTVVNEKGEAIAGATVAVKGTELITVTDASGIFSLSNIKARATIVISNVGYEARTYKLSGAGMLSIQLKIAAQDMKEVVISTGYQKVSRERFVGSYAQLDSASFHLRPGTSIVDRLDGMVTGMLFNRKSSQFPINIRGISTLGINGTSTDPLIILDNFPLPAGFTINRINPNDVESVTVLKDAAAASVWGARAANGVIVITTKKGRYNQRLKISLSSNITIEEEPDQYYVKRISPSAFIDVEQFLFEKGFYDWTLSNTSTWPVISPVVEILDRKKKGELTEEQASAQINGLRQDDIRESLKKDIYRHSVQQQQYLSVGGGNQSLSYQLSVGYNKRLNNIIGSKPDEQYTINNSVSFRPFSFLEVETGINFVQEKNRSYNYLLPSSVSPYAALSGQDGASLAVPYRYRQGYIDTAGAGKLLDWHYRPLDEIRNANVLLTNRTVRMNFGFNVTLAKWLKARLSYQYVTANASSRNLQNLESFDTRDIINLFTNPAQTNPNLRNPVPIGGVLMLSSSQRNDYNVRGSIQADKSWNEHELNVMLSGELSDSKGMGESLTVYGYNDEFATSRSNMDFFNFYPRIYAASPFSTQMIPNSNGYSEAPIIRFISVVGNFGYSLRDRYHIYGSARRDGANIFGVNTNNRWKPIWSAGAAWEISKESFFSLQWLSLLKVRASYGYTGNVNNTVSGKLTMTKSPRVAGFTSLPFSTVGLAANPDLRWEEVRIVNAGLDFQLLNNRISGSFEVYRKRSKDVIINGLLAPSTGLLSYPLNSASLKTAGFDLDLNTQNVLTGNFSWNSGLGISYAKTTVVDYITLTRFKAEEFVSYDLNATTGQILYGLSSYRWGGLDPETGDPQGILNGKITKDYMAIMSDSLGNQVFHGSSLPLYSMNLRNDFRWKGFTLSANIIGRFNYYFREPALNLDYRETWAANNYLEDYNRRWQKPGDETFTNVPSMLYPLPWDLFLRSAFYAGSSILVKRADNVRLQFINLSYQWNNKNSSRLPVQSAQFFCYVNNLNLILWRASRSYYDPEFNSTGLIGASGPSPKNWTVGVTIHF